MKSRMIDERGMYYGRDNKYINRLEYVGVGDRFVLGLIFKKWYGTVFPKLLYSRTPFGLEE